MKTKTIHISSKMKIHLYNGDLLSVEETKKILGTPNMPDEKAIEIRDGFRRLVEVIYDNYATERRKAMKKVRDEAKNKTVEEKATL